MNRLTGFFHKENTRMKAVVVTLIVVILAVFSFTLYENKENRVSYLEMYEERQQVYTEQLGNQLEELKSFLANDEEVISYFSEKAEVSANSWMFIIKGEEVLFAKNRQTTEELGKDKDRDNFLKNINTQSAIVTMVERTVASPDINQIQDTYTVGVITAESYALTQGNVQKHEIYINLLIIILVMLGMMAVIGVTAKLNQAERSLAELAGKMKRQNRKLEKSGEQLMSGEQAREESAAGTEETGSTGVHCYDSDLIRMFLEKSDDEALMPIQILLADIEMESRYYSRKEILDVLGELRKYLERTHVVGELQKGSFVILMYRTTKETAEDIVRRYEKETAVPMKMSLHEVTDSRSALKMLFDKDGQEGEHHHG